MDGRKSDMYEEASLHDCAQPAQTPTLIKKKNHCVLTHV